jgi:hypothetical protein
VAAARLAAEMEAGSSPADWGRALAARLQATQDALAAAAVARQATAFTRLLNGRAGVGGVYDLWRALRAFVAGERFVREHGEGER